jgi:hypothetical protein
MNGHDEDRTLPLERPEDPGDEESVRRLIESAGPRAEVPGEDLAAIAAAARLAWQRQLRETAADRPVRDVSAPRPPAVTGERRLRSRRPARVVLAALAAALVVAAGLGWWWAVRGGSAPATPPVVATVEAVKGTVRVATGAAAPRALSAGAALAAASEISSGGEPPGRASLRLAGGVTLRLDAGTRLRLASASVLVLERGALYADTGAQPPRDGVLEVRTPLGVVRDVGTRFAVRVVSPEGPDPDAGGGEPALLVRVRDGAVRTERSGRIYVTAAGEELALHGDGTAERHAIAAHGPDWEWVMEAAGGFDVEGRSLREFLDWVGRETGWRIAVEDEALARSASRIVLHGSLGALRADQAAFAVLPGAGLEAELRDGTLVVRR